MELLTGKEAAAFLRVSLSTLIALRSKGEIPCVRVGARKVMYRKESLIQYVNSIESRSI
jgi:excisionase family DNA binding protein